MILWVLASALSCLPIPSIDDENTPGQGNNVSAVYPVACYLFDGSAEDASNNGFDGILNGSPEFISDTPDGSSGALKLNAFKEQFVNIPYPILNGLDSYSFSAWIKDFSQGVIFSADGGQDIPYLYVRDTQRFMLFNNYYSGDLNAYTFAYDCTSIMSSSWHHLAVSSNEGVISLYIDGVKTDSMENGYTKSTCTKIYLGGNAGGTFTNYMTMKMDNVMFFDYCLTDAEVKYIYQNKL